MDAFAKGEILQVLFISVLTGAALSIGGKKDSPILRGIEEGQDVLFRILGFIMRVAPIGAFGAIAAAVGAHGSGTLIYLAKLVGLYTSRPSPSSSWSSAQWPAWPGFPS